VNGEMRTNVPTGDAVAEFALRLIRVPSLSGQEGDVAVLIREELARLGFEASVDDWGNVLGTIAAGPGPRVLVDAHMDTVGVTDPAKWSRDPRGERVGTRLYGRGAVDMKGPLAAAVHGLSTLVGTLERGTVVFSASVAEEFVEGPALRRVAEQVRPDYVVICEPTSLRLARGQRGRAEVRIEVAGRPTHSSRPDLGINAAEAMVDIVVALRGFAPPRHPVLGAGILVLTDIKSEPYPALSVVPDRCVATYDRRTLPGEREADVLGPIREAAERAVVGTGATARVSIAADDFTTYTGRRVTAPNFAPAWFFDEDAEIVAAAASGLAQAGLVPALGQYAFCTNGSATAGQLQIPSVGFGPGDEERAHRVDEWVDVEELAAAARAYPAIVRRLVGAKG
jgi:putative selenium metabolism hydrolase